MQRRSDRDHPRPARLAGRGRGLGRRTRPRHPRGGRAGRRRGARLHLTHLSTAAVDRPGPAREGGRPAGHLRRDAAPPRAHRRVGRRRAALGVGGGRRATGSSRIRGATRVLDGRAVRHVAARQPAAPRGRPTRSRASPGAARTAPSDAVATDHAPHTAVDKDVEFGHAANGISGIETALGRRSSRRSPRAGCRCAGRSRR